MMVSACTHFYLFILLSLGINVLLCVLSIQLVVSKHVYYIYNRLEMRVKIRPENQILMFIIIYWSPTYSTCARHWCCLWMMTKVRMTQALLTGSSIYRWWEVVLHKLLYQRGCATTQVYGVLWERRAMWEQLSLRQSLVCVWVSQVRDFW